MEHDGLIPIKDLPKKKNWKQLFDGVPEGFGLLVDEDYYPVYTALKSLQKREPEKYKHYRVMMREKKTYIIHDKEDI